MSEATPRLTVYEDKRHEWRWRLQAANNRIIADSGEGYKQRTGAVRAARRMARDVQILIDSAALADL